MFNSLKRRLGSVVMGVAAAGAMALGSSSVAIAQDNWPERPIKLIVGFNAGGTTDVVARILAEDMSQTLGQPIIVENRPGAGSNIATEMVKRAKPDGYTLYMVAVTAAINQTLYESADFDLTADFEPVSLAVKVPNVLVVHPSLPVNSVQELVDYAKAHPGTLNFASSGSGTSIHMAGELFKQLAEIDVAHIPYSGSAPAVTDLIGGQVDYAFDNMPSAWPHVNAGKLRALAVTTSERTESAPDLPTMKESGFETFDVSSWFGVVAPKGTPEEITQRLNEAMHTAMRKPDIQERLADLGAIPEFTSREEFAQFLAREVDSWGEVVIASGATVD